MCDPITMGAIYIGAEIYKGNEQGKATSDQLISQASVKDYNARQLRKDAVNTLETGKEAVGIHRAKVQQLKSNQRATIGASGVLVDDGTTADIITDTATMGEADALRIGDNYKSQADTMVEQAQFLNESAANDLSVASDARKKGFITGLLGGGTAAAGQWYDHKSAANQGAQ